MAAPNIVNVATITGKSAGVALTTGGAAIVTNSAGSGKVFKINSLYIANIDGSNAADVTVTFEDASPDVDYKIANTIGVPADATLVVIRKDTAIYLEEGDVLRGVASADGDLVAVVSYEELS